ncbi:MAG: DUF177 domain-containing protein [Pseudanabaena sp. RU_4_16]|nr:DUF177 domain-containing protein [Pseudanabaena sp. RU_4_16]
MENIFIPQLAKAVNATETIQFKEFIEGLDTLTPVQGVMEIKHLGSALAVKVDAWAIITLTCDRTLQQFNHRLCVNTSELIWLKTPGAADKLPKEQELDVEDLVESLPPNGYFDPAEWLYQQLCLAIPFRKIAPDAPEFTELTAAIEQQVVVDRRWSVLHSLKSSRNLTFQVVVRVLLTVLKYGHTVRRGTSNLRSEL